MAASSIDHDVIVVGGGSAGYAAARTARDEGADVAIVDPGPLGGLCILRGCMPSKSVLRSSDVMSLIRRAPEFGLSAPAPGADLAAIIDRKDRLIREFADYRVEQLRGFTLYESPARFTGSREIEVAGGRVKARAFVIATGSAISRPPVPGLAEAGFITSDDALDLRDLPASMVVLGGGPIACELAQFYCRLGVETVMIQRSGHILSQTDEDLARPVEARFREEGMQLYTGTKLHRLERANGVATVHFRHGDEERTASGRGRLPGPGPAAEHRRPRPGRRRRGGRPPRPRGRRHAHQPAPHLRRRRRQRPPRDRPHRRAPGRGGRLQRRPPEGGAAAPRLAPRHVRHLHRSGGGHPRPPGEAVPGRGHPLPGGQLPLRRPRQVDDPGRAARATPRSSAIPPPARSSAPASSGPRPAS